MDAGACRQSGNPYHATLAVSTPYELRTASGLRILPPGTPIFNALVPDDLRLEAHDPGWDPFAVEPFMIPEQYAVLSGLPGVQIREYENSRTSALICQGVVMKTVLLCGHGRKVGGGLLSLRANDHG